MTSEGIDTVYLDAIDTLSHAQDELKRIIRALDGVDRDTSDIHAIESRIHKTRRKLWDEWGSLRC